MRKFQLLILILLFLNITAALAEPVKILPLGDSITQGYGPVTSYRRPLWKLLEIGGYSVDFVGSEHEFGGNVSPALWDFDMNHEGYSSAKIEDIDEFLDRSLRVLDVDIALVHAGTNDVYAGQSIASSIEEMSRLFKNLRHNNPSVTILLAKIIPMRDTDVTLFNAALETWAEGQNTARSKVIMVDQFSDFNAMEDTYDNWHPNLNGELKMASRWYRALKGVLSKQVTQR